MNTIHNQVSPKVQTLHTRLTRELAQSVRVAHGNMRDDAARSNYSQIDVDTVFAGRGESRTRAMTARPNISHLHTSKSGVVRGNFIPHWHLYRSIVNAHAILAGKVSV